jgi:D-inositol-3-phosphate glycosyltransferase
LVDHESSGFLVEGRDPADFAAPVDRLLTDEILANDIGVNAHARSKRYSWSMTAGRLRRLYGDLVARGLVRCD